MRIVLDMSNQELVIFSDEIHALQLYLDLEVLRFEDTLSYQLNLEDVTKQDILIPPMLIQPHVENAIKHGLFHLNSARKLWIHCTLDEANQLLKCVIEDNGVGREKANKINAAGGKFGQRSTKDRLTLLNFGKKRKLGQEIIDLMDESGHPKGTRVILFIPYKNA